MAERQITEDAQWMQEALREAKKAASKNEVPIGAVALYKGQIIARSHNVREATQDPLGHAELRLLKTAARKLGHWRMPGLEVAVTLEPCLMCLEAMRQARVARIIFGLSDPKAGACGSVWDMRIDPHFRKIAFVGGVGAKESLNLLRPFFKKLRCQ